MRRAPGGTLGSGAHGVSGPLGTASPTQEMLVALPTGRPGTDPMTLAISTCHKGVAGTPCGARGPQPWASGPSVTAMTLEGTLELIQVGLSNLSALLYAPLLPKGPHSLTLEGSLRVKCRNWGHHHWAPHPIPLSRPLSHWGENTEARRAGPSCTAEWALFRRGGGQGEPLPWAQSQAAQSGTHLEGSSRRGGPAPQPDRGRPGRPWVLGGKQG